MRLLFFAAAGTLLLLTAALATPQEPQNTAKKDPAAFFDSKVAPILNKSCVPCHSGAEGSARLDMTTREGILKGGVSGPAVVVGKPKKSLLIKAVHYEGRQMPPQGKLPKAQLDILTEWVAMGAPWGKETQAADTHHGPPPVNDKTKKFWSFQPVQRPAMPKVKWQDWVRNPIDAFVLAKLEKNGLKPSPTASRAALMRRAYYDVTGLPPSPEEVQAFLADKSPDAWEKVVDRLLASPQYGERWGRHWLDLVRYAETNSFERDGDKPFVWRYRDYVIRSFNEDKPYDRFIREQLAGDELPDRSIDSLIATGYYRLGQWDDEPADPKQARWDELDDILSTTGQTFLGLTVGCARCHDHKIDPFPAKDYYRMAAFLVNTNRYGIRDHASVERWSVRPISSETEQERFQREMTAFRAELKEVETAIKAIEDIVAPTFQNVEKEDFRSEQNRIPIVQKRVPDTLSEEKFAEYVRLMEKHRALRAKPPRGLEMALVVTERGRTCDEETHVLLRGSAHAEGEKVTPGFPSVLSPPEPVLSAAPQGVESSGRRTALANWIASPKNPLTSRVMANRLWQYHFGRGIVRSSSNFGFLGTAPTHPELLDWLASELVAQGWRLKPVHRMILLSNTYKQSSVPNEAALKKDPENDLFWRFDMRRLEAEELRDSILSANGSLNTKMFGPSILVKLPQEVLAGQSVPGAGWGESSPEEQRRRSVYIKVKRSLPVPTLASFDSADVDATCPVRFATTQPTQALHMLNSAFVNEQATVFAKFAEEQSGSDPAKQVEFVLWRTLQRPPTAMEVERGVRLIADLKREDGQNGASALRQFCLIALNLNEFIFLD
ncbi:MAG: PSD1 and planctomycete cytochrome C domain-containing protein [Armatimonadaceae bacterium]